MTVEHLQGKRTGRPRGSRSASPVKRDLLWAARNLGKDRQPPTAGAKFWIDMARNEPERFLAALAALDAGNTQSCDEKPRNEPQTGNTVARAGQRLMRVLLTETDLLKVFSNFRASTPEDAKLVGCAFAQALNGVIFTIRSATFRSLAEGELIPELKRRFSSGPTIPDDFRF